MDAVVQLLSSVEFFVHIVGVGLSPARFELLSRKLAATSWFGWVGRVWGAVLLGSRTPSCRQGGGLPTWKGMKQSPGWRCCLSSKWEGLEQPTPLLYFFITRLYQIYSGFLVVSLPGFITYETVACSCLDPMDCSLPDSSVRGIFQAIVLEWIAISFKGVYKSWPRAQCRNFEKKIISNHFSSSIWVYPGCELILQVGIGEIELGRKKLKIIILLFADRYILVSLSLVILISLILFMNWKHHMLILMFLTSHIFTYVSLLMQ